MATFSLLVNTQRGFAEPVSAALFEAGAEGVEARPGKGATLVVYGSDGRRLKALWRRAARRLKAQLGTSFRPLVSFATDHEERWKTGWYEQLRAQRLTPTVSFVPVGAEAPERARDVLWFRPALAFGDGAHATTRLAARAVERHFRRTPGGALLDIGTGSGVLSLVALKSGALRAVGSDTSAAALRAARHNATLNGLHRRVRFVAPGTPLRGPFALVVVNVELRPLLAILRDLPRAAQRAPKLLVTGFLREQGALVRAALYANDWRVARRSSEDDWQLFEASRKS
jgi:ribosomal protein L11 methyltransferase